MWAYCRALWQRLWWRITSRSFAPVVVRQVHARDADGHQDRRHAGDRQFQYTPPGGMDPAETAARTIFAPTHEEEQCHEFASMNNDGTVVSSSELWDRENNSMRTRRRRTLMVTCSRGVVLSPEAIRGMCSVCGGPDDSIARCDVCGATLCQLDGRVLEYPTGPQILCPTHLAIALDQWDTWLASDCGFSRAKAGPFSLSKYSHAVKSQS